jgi:penicillin-binding protein 2
MALPQNAETARLRLAMVGVVVLCLFAAMFARLWYLQVMASHTYVTASINNQVRRIFEPAPRGRILDRQGRVLVDNRVSEVVTISRVEASKDPVTLARLAALLQTTTDELNRRVADPRFSPYKPVPVAEDVDKSKVIYIREHQEDFPGVEANPTALRTYPYGTVAAHLLGYVGEINDSELAPRKSKGYRQGDDIGKSGVEQSYEDVLRGTPGVTTLEVDSQGNTIRTLSVRPPEQGHDIQLTIDLDVQKLTEESLVQGLDTVRSTVDKSTGNHYPAPAGAAVVLDPRDGSVLAMASVPTYDPSAFINGIKPAVFQQLQDPGSHFPLNNRAIQGLYAPGSTFKLATASAALKTGLITAAYGINDTGSLKVGNRVFHNALNESYGHISLTRAITVSSDVYFYNLGNMFWSQRGKYGNAIQDQAKALGFGVKTGIPLTGEANGRIPDPDSRKRLHDQNPKAFPNGQWFAGDNVNLAIGQGETVVTPLQLANAYATFGNGGTVYEPRIAAHVLDHDGHVISDIKPKVVRQVPLPPDVRDPILAGLKGAVSDPKGTAHAAFAGFPTDAFDIAGKTGTAQVVGKEDTAVFTSFAPADNPQYEITVLMEESGFGGTAAAPVARRVYEGLAGKPVTPIQLGGGVD